MCVCVCVYVYIGGSRIQPVAVLPSTYPPLSTFIHMAISMRLHTFDSKGLPLTSYLICPNLILLLWLQVMWIQPHTDISSREWYSSDAC